MDKRLWLTGAIVWGAAEATFFFIVPDVILTAAVIAYGWRQALRFAGAAALAAAIGGYFMWRLGAASPDAARDFLLSVPLLGQDLIERVQSEINGAWPVHLTLGAITGAPYKIYAAEAGAANINPALFAAMSVLARFARFALLIAIVALGKEALKRIGKDVLAPWALAAMWTLVYIVYGFIRLNAGT